MAPPSLLAWIGWHVLDRFRFGSLAFRQLVSGLPFAAGIR